LIARQDVATSSTVSGEYAKFIFNITGLAPTVVYPGWVRDE